MADTAGPEDSSDPRAGTAEPGSDNSGDAGVDAVRSALGRARAAAAAKGLQPRRRRGARGDGARRRAGQRSGSGPDGRDPQPFGASIGRLVAERGWTTPVAVGGVLGRWDQVVGADVAAHCQPESFDEAVLVVRADSTAWATQMRLLAPTILRRLAEELGPGVVERFVVKGPAGPSWRRGPRSAYGGRGPRDTYG